MTLASAGIGSTYSARLTATGGTGADTWSVSSGALPAGLTLTAATGAITGTPRNAGGSSFTVTATDSAIPAQTASRSLSLTVAAQSVSAIIGNKKVTLESAAATLCVAKTATLPVTLTSTTAGASGKAATKVKLGAIRLYIGRGRKLEVVKRVHVRSIVYAANATVQRLPANVQLALAGQSSGNQTLSAVISYTLSVQRHGRAVIVTPTKTLRVHFVVC